MAPQLLALTRHCNCSTAGKPSSYNSTTRHNIPRRRRFATTSYRRDNVSNDKSLDFVNNARQSFASVSDNMTEAFHKKKAERIAAIKSYQDLQEIKSNPPSTGIPFTKFFSDTFPLPLAEAYKQWTVRGDLKQAEEDVLSFLPFYPEPDATRMARSLQVPVGDGNWINEFEISPTAAEATNDLVLLHGYGAGLAFFYQNLDSLSSVPGWRLHALDLLGYGRSSRPKFKVNATDPYEKIRETENFFIDSLEQWRIAKGLDRFTFVAHSMGAYFASAYAMKYPGHIKKLVLVSPAGVPRSPFSIAAQKAAKEKRAVDAAGNPTVPKTSVEIPGWFNYLWEQNVSPFFLVRGTGPLGPRVVSGWTSRRFANLPRDQADALHRYVYTIFNAPGSGEYALNYLLAPGAHARWPLADRAKDIPCDTIWMYGQNDWMDTTGGLEAIQEIRAHNQNVETPSLHVIENAGHHIFLDNPHDFNELVISVMKQVEDMP